MVYESFVLQRFRLVKILDRNALSFRAPHIGARNLFFQWTRKQIPPFGRNDNQKLYAFPSLTISEKSAIVENSFNSACSSARRFARTRASSTMTITLSKNLSTGSRAVESRRRASTYPRFFRSSSTLAPFWSR